MAVNVKRRPESLSQNRTLVLGEIELENINYVIEDILIITEEDLKKRGPKTNKQPIKLIINSPGGDVYAALGLVDVIKNSSTPIHTICLGHAMSAAFFIFVTGHKRFAGKHATFMYHDVSSYVEASVTTIKREVKECERLVEIMDKLVIEHTNIQPEFLEDIRIKHINKYFTAEEALSLNIIDEIL